MNAPHIDATPTHTPWGKPNYSVEQGPGIVYYSTPSHGGYWLSRHREKQRRCRFPTFNTFAGGPWYEQDQDAAILALTFPDYFEADALRNATRAVRAFARRPGHTIAVRGWACIIAWLDSDDPNALDILARVERRTIEVQSLWERGSYWTAYDRGYPRGTWGVTLSRASDKAVRTVYMPYPERRYYTDDELNALEVRPLSVAG